MCERLPNRHRVKTTAAVCLFIMLVSLVGCAQPDQRPEGAPKWVKQPAPTGESEEYLCAVGASEPEGSEPPDEARARTRSRAQLSHAVRKYVRDMLEGFVKQSEEYAGLSEPVWQDFIRLLAAEVSASILRRDMSYEAWRDPSAGTLYVMSRVKPADVHALIRREAENLLGDVNPFGEKEKEGLEQLAAFLKGELEKRPEPPDVEEVVEQSSEPEDAEDSPPAWLTGGSHPDYPSEEYLSAVGLGQTPEGAEDAAHREMAASLDSAIAKKFKGLKESEASDPLVRNIKALQSETVKFGEADLVHSRVVETWRDSVTGTRYALAILNREKGATAFRNRATSAMSHAVEVSGSGANHRSAGNYRKALESYLAATEYGQKAVKYQLAGLILQPSKSAEWKKLLGQAIVAETRSAVQAVLGNVKLQKVSGDDQWTATGMGLKEPLTVRLVGGESKPLAEWPVSFRAVQGKAQLESAGETDADGKATCRVVEVASAPGPTVAVRAELNLKPLAGEADVAGLEVPGVKFVCVLRSKSNSHFAVYVDESMPGGEPAVNPVIADGVSENMETAGFTLMDRKLVQKRARAYGLAGDSESDAVLEAFAPLQREVEGKGFLLVAIIDADAKVVESVETSQGTLQIVHAPVKVRVIDPLVDTNGKPTVISFQVTGKGAHTGSVSKAARMARERVAKQVVEKLIVRLEDRFGGG